ncbi:efflux RND transporter periplasmic adaptor subunit [Acidobacterium sp. S8]|uniref:efflux RND transporter periplasmic adaptor subunit n=1 Tax=Acidobacterium sp. S8 TaxID=1641854 RepID=UPI00131C2A8C|nr:efflux RND transporter periplasmic adaptor subunit [Acidobacterium sp. S8]
MALIETEEQRRSAGRFISLASVLCALITGLLVIHATNNNPRTDDAEVFANFIGVAPVVSGPIMKLNVTDNQLVKQGDLLFDIDERPYAYALAQARSDRSSLEGRIVDESRTIASQGSAVDVARASARSAEANVARAAAAVDEAKADVANAKAAVDRADAELAYATNNLHRIEPLLAKQFVTVDQIDQARTLQTTRQQASHQARSQLALSQARLESANAQYLQAQAMLEQSHQQVQQAAHAVTTLEPLTAQRPGRSSAIDLAQYNFENCRYIAPFDGRVTNLTISEGAYAHTGQQVFTLIDTRTWWVVANFRETQLHRIRPGMKADVYVLSRPNIRFSGVVDSIGFGVTPDADIVGRLSQGLPDVQRTLNWVHLASRFPVRVRIEAGPNDIFRLSESAVVIIRGSEAPATRN